MRVLAAIILSSAASSPRETQSPDIPAVLWTLIAAVVGGLLTIAGDIGVRLFFDRSRANRLRKALQREVDTILDEARRRSGLATQASAIRLLPPLPTDVWNEMVSTGIASTLESKTAQVVWDFYRKVEVANYIGAQVPTFLLVANIASDADVRRAFADEAGRIAAEPFADIVDAATAVKGRLGGRITSDT